MSVQRTIRLRLKPTAEQRAALLATLAESTACFNAVAAYGWEHEQRNSVELHKATYYPLRTEHPSLPSQLVVSARMRAGEAITSALTRKRQGRKTSCPTGAMVPIRYDARYRNAALNIRDRHLVGWASGPADGLSVKEPIVGASVEIQHGATRKPPASAGGT